jgi:hypothetical protein
LVLLAILGLLVEYLLISDLPHLFGIAVLNIESVVAFEQHVLGELLGLLALILLLEVDESLLGPWHDLDLLRSLIWIALVEEDPQLLLSGTQREVLDKQTEVHDGLLVLEVVYHHLLDSLRLLFGLSHIEIGCLETKSLISSLVLGIVLLVVKSDLLSSSRVFEADKAETFGESLTISHDSDVLDPSKGLEQLLEVLLGVLEREALHIDIVECLLVRGESALLALVLKH